MQWSVQQYLGILGISWDRQPRIGNEIIKGHTTCSASTSKDGLRGLSVTDILEIGFWCNASNWQRFYHRQNESCAENNEIKF